MRLQVSPSGHVKTSIGSERKELGTVVRPRLPLDVGVNAALWERLVFRRRSSLTLAGHRAYL